MLYSGYTPVNIKLIVFLIYHNEDIEVFIMNTIYNYLSYFWGKTVPFITRGMIMYAVVIGLHYSAANLYPRMCTPVTVIGFIMSPFMVIAPHCAGLRWLITFTGTQIQNMWLWLAGYLICYADGVVRDNFTSKTPTENKNTVDVTTQYPQTRSRTRSVNNMDSGSE